ncbi:MAG: hypothetical protein JRI23_21400 [Deltaproteobacteria bacterium]|jgi:hypothetical protein|nr:hypothetical protein [Deltaproteobacteria bacterium]MBW2534498.1 hypothetical protein [Deltaproteobacteria bacterium]
MVRWLAAFVFTQVCECPIYVVAQRGSPRRTVVKLALAFGASALTHPVVWFVIPWLWYDVLGARSYWGMAGVAETFAVAAEGLYFRQLGVRRPWLWALGANLTSVTLGLTSRHLFGMP